MTVQELAKLIGRHHSCISRFKSQGVIPEYPEGYKQMNAEELADYIEECKRMIEWYLASSTDRRRAGYRAALERRKKYGESFELPDYLKRLEQEYGRY